MTYTNEEKICYVRKWAESSLSKADFSTLEGIDEGTLRKWSYRLIGEDLVDDWKKLKIGDQKQMILKALNGEVPSSITGRDMASSSNKPFVLLSGRRNGTSQVSIEFMGAMIRADENSLESVLRALKRISG